MPTRLIRDGILSSERVNALSANAEVFYRRLMSVADDHGRFTANLALLRASCYPLRLDKMKEDLVRGLLEECVAASLIRLYMVDGKPYLLILDFGQRAQSKPRYPDPPQFTVENGESQNKTALGGDGCGVEDVGESSPEPLPATQAPAIEISLNDGSQYGVSQEQLLG